MAERKWYENPDAFKEKESSISPRSEGPRDYVLSTLSKLLGDDNKAMRLAIKLEPVLNSPQFLYDLGKGSALAVSHAFNGQYEAAKDSGAKAGLGALGVAAPAGMGMATRRALGGIKLPERSPDYSSVLAAHADEPLQLFSTARGSTYAQYPDASTIRNRASGVSSPGSGSEGGLQPKSRRTVFMNDKDVTDIGGLHQNREFPGLLEPVPDKPGYMGIRMQEDYGPRKAREFVPGTIRPYSTKPEVGAIPVEYFSSTPKGIHFGNKITHVQKHTPKKAAGGAITIKKAPELTKMSDMRHIARAMSQYGRRGDDRLVHMSGREVAALNRLAPQGLTRNPQTGLPEAFNLKDLIGPVLTAGATAAGYGEYVPHISAAVGLGTYAATGNLSKGISAGLLSYGAGELTKEFGGEGALTDLFRKGADRVTTSGPGGSLTSASMASLPSPVTATAANFMNTGMEGPNTFLGDIPSASTIASAGSNNSYYDPIMGTFAPNPGGIAPVTSARTSGGLGSLSGSGSGGGIWDWVKKNPQLAMTAVAALGTLGPQGSGNVPKSATSAPTDLPPMVIGPVPRLATLPRGYFPGYGPEQSLFQKAPSPEQKAALQEASATTAIDHMQAQLANQPGGSGSPQQQAALALQQQAALTMMPPGYAEGGRMSAEERRERALDSLRHDSGKGYNDIDQSVLDHIFLGDLTKQGRERPVRQRGANSRGDALRLKKVLSGHSRVPTYKDDGNYVEAPLMSVDQWNKAVESEALDLDEVPYKIGKDNWSKEELRDMLHNPNTWWHEERHVDFPRDGQYAEGGPVGLIAPGAGGMSTAVMDEWVNYKTGEKFTANNGGYSATPDSGWFRAAVGPPPPPPPPTGGAVGQTFRPSVYGRQMPLPTLNTSLGSPATMVAGGGFIDPTSPYYGYSMGQPGTTDYDRTLLPENFGKVPKVPGPTAPTGGGGLGTGGTDDIIPGSGAGGLVDIFPRRRNPVGRPPRPTTTLPVTYPMDPGEGEDYGTYPPVTTTVPPVNPPVSPVTPTVSFTEDPTVYQPDPTVYQPVPPAPKPRKVDPAVSFTEDPTVYTQDPPPYGYGDPPPVNQPVPPPPQPQTVNPAVSFTEDPTVYTQDPIYDGTFGYGDPPPFGYGNPPPSDVNYTSSTVNPTVSFTEGDTLNNPPGPDNGQPGPDYGSYYTGPGQDEYNSYGLPELTSLSGQYYNPYSQPAGNYNPNSGPGIAANAAMNAGGMFVGPAVPFGGGLLTGLSGNRLTSYDTGSGVAGYGEDYALNPGLLARGGNAIGRGLYDFGADIFGYDPVAPLEPGQPNFPADSRIYTDPGATSWAGNMSDDAYAQNSADQAYGRPSKYDPTTGRWVEVAPTPSAPQPDLGGTFGNGPAPDYGWSDTSNDFMQGATFGGGRYDAGGSGFSPSEWQMNQGIIDNWQPTNYQLGFTDMADSNSFYGGDLDYLKMNAMYGNDGVDRGNKPGSAAGGPVRRRYAEGGPIEEAPREVQQAVIDGAKEAILGQSEQPDVAIQQFIQLFGEEALQQLVAAVQGHSGPVSGSGDGVSDNVPAIVDGQEPVRLANDEHVLSADVVSALGNGSSDAGHKALLDMTSRVRGARVNGKAMPNSIEANKYLPA